MTVLDISYAQDTVNWQAVMEAPGLEGVWIRASHGAHADTRFAFNAFGAHKFKLPHQWIGYYHFAEYGSGEVPFSSAFGPGWVQPDRLCIDVEGHVPPNVNAWLSPRLVQSDGIKTTSGEQTWLYSYESLADHLVGAFANRRWWIARVADALGNPGKTPPSYSKYALWQFSWVEHWPGIPGHVDASHIGPGFPGGSIPTPGGPIVADKVLSSPLVHSSWVLRDSGEVDTLRGKAFYGAWLSLDAATRSKADVKEFVDFTLRDDGNPGYTIWVLTNSGAVHPYDFG